MFKYYAVHKGQIRGIYEYFNDVRDVIQDYPKPVYKGFNEYYMAQKWLDQSQNETILASEYNKLYLYAYRNKNIKKLFYTKNECLQFQKKNGGEFKQFLFRDEAEEWLYGNKQFLTKLSESQNTIIISDDEFEIEEFDDKLKYHADQIKLHADQIEIIVRKKIKQEQNKFKNLKIETHSMNKSIIENFNGFQL